MIRQALYGFLVLAMAAVVQGRAELAARPNILLILADDMGFSDAGCYGGEIATPNLDRLATNGVRFTQFYNTARCWPTRAALLSGYYPQQIRMDPPRGRLPEWAKLLPQYLKSAGYRSYHSGKWHINGAPKTLADGGFDRSYRLEDHDRNFYPKNVLLDDRPLPPVPKGSNYYTTVAFADFMISCLQDHASNFKERPFFGYLAFTVPHFPLQALPEDIARYRDRYLAGWDAIREERHQRQSAMNLVQTALSPREPDTSPHWNLREAALREQISPAEVGRAVAWSELSPGEKRFQATKMAIHAAMIDRMDREIGRVLEQLKAMGALENTIVLFASDNGASAEFLNRGDKHDASADPGSGGSYLCLGPGWSTAANTPFRLHKSWVHEGGISTPLIVHWPQGIAARGELRRTMGHVIDIVPTLLELTGLTNAAAFPGRSLVPALARDLTVPRDFLFFHHEHNRALRIGDWKLVSKRPNTNDYSLYNLATDRAEQNDLAQREPERVRAMARRWQELEGEFRNTAFGPPSTNLAFIDTSFENASPLWYERGPDGVFLVHLLYDHERSSPNRAAGHFHFRLQAPKGTKVSLEFRNLENVWNGRPGSVARELKTAVISSDGKDWTSVPLQGLPGDRVRLNIEMPGDSLFVARVEPYRLSDLDRLLAAIRRDPRVLITEIGKTVQGRNLEIIRIGDAGLPNRVFLRARAHPWEAGSNWIVEGLIERLLRNDDPAREFLGRYCVYILPMANKDGVALGRTRFNLQGKDLNRNWDQPADAFLCPENAALEKWLESSIKAGAAPTLALELHNDGNGQLHLSRPPIEGLEGHLQRMQSFEQWLRKHTWFTEGSTAESFRNSGTLGEGWLERYGIDSAVHEFNCNWIAGLNDYPSARHWKEYGEGLAQVFFDYFGALPQR